jgi:hypothetical protein
MFQEIIVLLYKSHISSEKIIVVIEVDRGDQWFNYLRPFMFIVVFNVFFLQILPPQTRQTRRLWRHQQAEEASQRLAVQIVRLVHQECLSGRSIPEGAERSRTQRQSESNKSQQRQGSKAKHKSCDEEKKENNDSESDCSENRQQNRWKRYS